MELKDIPFPLLQQIYAAQAQHNHQPECYRFEMFKNLTEYEAKFADKLCDIRPIINYNRYEVIQYGRELRALSIATLVLSAITMLSLTMFIVYRLVTYYYKRQQQQQISIQD
ncbi:hypothetical protein BCR42DRAFT_428148 [Absidia repens]|uniref:Uncharacterized protein n=1 Tax=Absidia repens TaxID=90262 RepID=A0A1X2HYQ9_9FUNG|nr:hypothetical protein BCR42DRAFT_428148 [Absidia repens]